MKIKTFLGREMATSDWKGWALKIKTKKYLGAVKAGESASSLSVHQSSLLHQQLPKKSLYKISIITTLFFIMLGVFEELSLSYFLIIIFSGILILFKILKCNLKKPVECLKFFKENLWFGVLFLTAILCS